MRTAAHCGCPETDSFSDRAITNLDVAEESENEAYEIWGFLATSSSKYKTETKSEIPILYSK